MPPKFYSVKLIIYLCPSPSHYKGIQDPHEKKNNEGDSRKARMEK